MSVTNSIRALLNMKGFRQCDLLPVFEMANVQSLSNKFRGERWSAVDLVKIAEFCGAKLVFVLPNGERVLISADPPAAPAPGAADEEGTGGGIGGGADSAGVTPVSNPKKKMGHSKAK